MLQKGNAIFDYTKFIMAIMVLAIHSALLPELLYPWLRLAVPLFFIISSYFFFKKYRRAESGAERGKVIKKFLIRNLQLYSFWFIVLLIPTIGIRKWFSHGIFTGILLFLRDLFFSSTFVASWYIMASVIAILIIVFLSRKLPNWLLLGISFVIYLFCCAFSGYEFFFRNLLSLSNMMDGYIKVMTEPQMSFSVALFWVVIGKCFADGTFDSIFSNMSKKITIAVISAALLLGEWLMIRHFSGKMNYDCLIALAFLAPALFAIIKDFTLPVGKPSIFLRNASTIIYASHGTVTAVIDKVIFNYDLPAYAPYLKFFGVGALCICASLVVLYLEKYKIFKFLKYSH